MAKNIKKVIIISVVAPFGCLAALWIGIIALVSLGALLNLPVAPSAETREGTRPSGTSVTY